MAAVAAGGAAVWRSFMDPPEAKPVPPASGVHPPSVPSSGHAAIRDPQQNVWPAE